MIVGCAVWAGVSSFAAYWKVFGPALAVSVGFAGFCFYYPYRRRESLKALARRRNLEWLGDTLPADFPVEMMEDLGPGFYHRRLRNAENVMSGVEGGERLLAFDGVSHNGSWRFTRTWVARRVSGPDVPVEMPGSLIYKEQGAWRAMARRSPLVLRRTMSAKAIEEVWRLLGNEGRG